MFEKLAQKFQGLKTKDDGSKEPVSLVINPATVYRYRKQRGVNLGALFVQEKWICHSTFTNTPGEDPADLDIVQNDPNAKAMFEKHWDSWIDPDKDFDYLVERGINTVRLPIGYYHCVGLDPSILKGTDFEKYADVFSGAWDRIDKTIIKAGEKGIGVLIDFHAAVGGQNPQAHSAVQGPSRLFSGSFNQSQSTAILKLVASKIAGYENVVGLELLNEPQMDDKLFKWNEKTIEAIREVVGEDFPLIIGDSWLLDHAASWASSRTDFTIIDTHVYRCFTPHDASQSSSQLAAALTASNEFIQASEKTKGCLIVGEWSGALNPQSFGGKEGGEKDALEREWVRAQLDVFEKTCGGWFFWTYKKEAGWDAGWDFRDACQAEIFHLFLGTKRNSSSRTELLKKEGADSCKKAVESHSNYWSSTSPGEKMEHDRFEKGYIQGWEDAAAFLASTIAGQAASELGYVGRWKYLRSQAHVAEFGDSKYVWEYGHGFDQGVKEAKEAYTTNS